MNPLIGAFAWVALIGAVIWLPWYVSVFVLAFILLSFND